MKFEVFKSAFTWCPTLRQYVSTGYGLDVAAKGGGHVCSMKYKTIILLRQLQQRIKKKKRRKLYNAGCHESKQGSWTVGTNLQDPRYSPLNPTPPARLQFFSVWEEHKNSKKQPKKSIFNIFFFPNGHIYIKEVVYHCYYQAPPTSLVPRPQELDGFGRSNTMGGFVGWKLTVQVDAFIKVV